MAKRRKPVMAYAATDLEAVPVRKPFFARRGTVFR